MSEWGDVVQAFREGAGAGGTAWISSWVMASSSWSGCAILGASSGPLAGVRLRLVVMTKVRGSGCPAGATHHSARQTAEQPIRK